MLDNYERIMTQSQFQKGWIRGPWTDARSSRQSR